MTAWHRWDTINHGLCGHSPKIAKSLFLIHAKKLRRPRSIRKASANDALTYLISSAFVEYPGHPPLADASNSV